MQGFGHIGFGQGFGHGSQGLRSQQQLVNANATAHNATKDLTDFITTPIVFVLFKNLSLFISLIQPKFGVSMGCLKKKDLSIVDTD